MKATESFDFGRGLKELEEITAWFEGENIDLDEGLVKFERGMELASKLKAHLAETQNRVEQIKLKFNQATPPPAVPSEDALPESNAQMF